MSRSIRVNLTLPVLRLGIGPIAIDPLEQLMGARLSDLLEPLMTGPRTERRTAGDALVDVYALALPDGEGASIPLGSWGELAFFNDAGVLALTLPAVVSCHMRHVVLWLAAGCANAPLDPGFEDEITQGWVCMPGTAPATGGDARLVYYTGLDDRATFRVQAGLWTGVDAALGESSSDNTFIVGTGKDLGIDGDVDCNAVRFPSQRLDYQYAAVEGSARVIEDGDRFGIETTGVVLRATEPPTGEPGWEDLPDVSVADGVLPSFPVSGS